MADQIYRKTYRVEVRYRDPTAAEAEVVAGHVRAYEDEKAARQAQERARHLPRRLASSLALVFAAIVLAPRSALAAIGLLLLGLLPLCATLLRDRQLARAWTYRGPWGAPAGGWKIRETRVVARSVVRVVSADMDYPYWLLFEIPGGDWFFMEGTARDEDYARAELVLTCLWPDGPSLDVTGKGDAIPLLGASDADFDADYEAGRTWSPDTPASSCPEADLPAWVLAYAGRGPAS